MAAFELTARDLAALPKAELHVHLEGTARPATMEEFISRSILPVPRSFNDLNGFVESYGAVWRTMNTPGDYGRLVREYCEDAVRSGIRYAEISLATAGRPYPCLVEAVEAAAKQSDVVVRFIVDIPRSLPVDVGWILLEAARDVPDVVAIGLGGPERAFPPEPFASLFDEARNRGLRSVPHAGEDAGVASIRGALDALKAERIMHGVRAVDDTAIVAELTDRKVALALCPTSNVRLGVVRTLEDHPIRELWGAGVVVSVNTDDPGFFGSDLVSEYAIAGRLLGLDRTGYGRLALNSVDSSYAPEGLKAEMRAGIAHWVNGA